MTNEYKTLRELNVQPGDVVENKTGVQEIVIDITDGAAYSTGGYPWFLDNPVWRIVSRASETTKTWSEMTPEEKGALLLAHHEGKVIEVRAQLADTWSVRENPNWCEGGIFRVRHEPVHETIVMFGEPGFAFSPDMQDGDNHRITFNLIDGKPDCDSIKMEEL
jgi:hypothetical protein